jgi:acyl carrier protein
MSPKLQNVIAEAFGLDAAEITADTAPGNQPRWDSLRHMQLIFALEDAYGVRFADGDIPRLTSVEAISAVLAAQGITA